VLTADALPYGSCACTTTEKVAPAVGLEPPFTDVTASLDGAALATFSVRPAPFEWLPSSTVTCAVSVL